MSELTFSAQPERPSFVVPGIIVGVIVVIVAALAYFLVPRSDADVSIVRTAVVPTHTVYAPNSIVVGQAQTEDELYVLATVHIDDKAKVPLFIKDLTGTLATGQGDPTTTSAVEANELANLYLTFPAVKLQATAPLLRESSIQPGQSAEGMVLLHFPVDLNTWNNRKSAVVTIAFYHQDPINVTIPFTNQ
jgi:hypothetical protein